MFAKNAGNISRRKSVPRCDRPGGTDSEYFRNGATWPGRHLGGDHLVYYTQLAYSMKSMADAPMTVVETARFLKDVKPMMSDSKREELVAFVGANPQAGNVIPETGGVRKIRWALAGRGKRGGARVIYYYQDERLPVFLLAAYGKNEKANLTMAERNAMKRLIPVLVAGYSVKDRRAR